jgi:iron complex transport system permease protein
MSSAPEASAVEPPSTGRRGRGATGARRVLVVLLVFGALAAGCVLFSLLVGATRIDLEALLRFDPETLDYQKVFRHRLPRSMAALIVGGALALAGLVFQALIRNPLASPYILGVSAGGSLGAVLALALGVTFVSPAAFLGACVAILLVYGVARTGGRVPAGTLLLAGVVVNAFFSASIMLVNLLSARDDQARILRWLVGGLREDYDAGLLLPSAGATLLLLVLLFFLSRQLNLLSLGDLAAERAGVSVARTRTVLYLLASLGTAAAVSISGPIGFVGLIVPHFLRLILGPDHRLLVPAAVLAGGGFLSVVDTLAQSIFVLPLPAGVVTAFLGGPLFLILLKRRDRRRAGLDE